MQMFFSLGESAILRRRRCDKKCDVIQLFETWLMIAIGNAN